MRTPAKHRRSVRALQAIVVALMTTVGLAGAPSLASADLVNSVGVLGVSCPSVKLCVAVDDHGDVLTSTNPTGGKSAWTITHVSPRALKAISCGSPNLCIAIEAHGLAIASTRPTGGAKAWRTFQYEPVGDSGPSSGAWITCTGTRLCIADTGTPSTSAIATSTNPMGGSQAWQVTDFHVNEPNAAGQRLYYGDASCPSPTFCVLGSSGPVIATSTTPTGGASAWAATVVPIYPQDQSLVSCPSVALCVDLPMGGRGGGSLLLASSDPAGGATTWKVTGNEPDAYFVGVTCAAATLCVAYGTGAVMVSTDPTAASGAWKRDGYASRGTFTDTMSCPSTSLCVGFDDLGDAVTSTRPTAGAWKDVHIIGKVTTQPPYIPPGNS